MRAIILQKRSKTFPYKNLEGYWQFFLRALIPSKIKKKNNMVLFLDFSNRNFLVVAFHRLIVRFFISFFGP